MQIEQNFRDDKNARFGLGWEYSRTKGVQRITVLCLIATLTQWLLLRIALAAEKKQWHWQFQANTLKNKRVLSFMKLARNIIAQPYFLRRLRPVVQ